MPFGGGERFIEELARALADRCEVRLVSYGPRARREELDCGLERVILRTWTPDPMTPYSPGLRAAVRGFDVVHLFQYFSLPTFLAARWGKQQGSRVFVTDLGGGGWTPGYHFDQSRWIDAHLPLSEYAARNLPGRVLPRRVLGGGVDPARFAMRRDLGHDGSVVFLGRLLPHKGVHFLIEAATPAHDVHVIGPAADFAYVDQLKRLATGKRVFFHHELSDAGVVGFLQRAMALVHPTPVDSSGSARAHELFGLALVEAMSCGCPVIASAVASLPEIVEDGVNGVLVAPNRALDLREQIQRFAADRGWWAKASVAARRAVEAKFTWTQVAARALGAYRSDGQDLNEPSAGAAGGRRQP